MNIDLRIFENTIQELSKQNIDLGKDRRKESKLRGYLEEKEQRKERKSVGKSRIERNKHFEAKEMYKL